MYVYFICLPSAIHAHNNPTQKQKKSKKKKCQLQESTFSEIEKPKNIHKKRQSNANLVFIHRIDTVYVFSNPSQYNYI